MTTGVLPAGVQENQAARTQRGDPLGLALWDWDVVLALTNDGFESQAMFIKRPDFDVCPWILPTQLFNSLGQFF
ncbi:MAG: hypothetical protein K6T90_00835 [Leptolyngbyaceae cyanobacterium HOT.MB2.61]|nr:hypothetical protein [Leptolyngbyaceae cyanobacterium HOT.MB2.61]